MQPDEIQENFSLATVFCDKEIRRLKENQKSVGSLRSTYFLGANELLEEIY